MRRAGHQDGQAARELLTVDRSDAVAVALPAVAGPVQLATVGPQGRFESHER